MTHSVKVYSEVTLIFFIWCRIYFPPNIPEQSMYESGYSTIPQVSRDNLHNRSLLYPWTQSDLTWRPGINWWRPSDDISPHWFYYNLMTCTLKQNVATSSVFTKNDLLEPLFFKKRKGRIGSARFVHKKDRTGSAQTDPIFLNRAEPS